MAKISGIWMGCTFGSQRSFGVTYFATITASADAAPTIRAYQVIVLRDGVLPMQIMLHNLSFSTLPPPAPLR
jgi:hypothetical protein